MVATELEEGVATNVLGAGEDDGVSCALDEVIAVITLGEDGAGDTEFGSVRGEVGGGNGVPVLAVIAGAGIPNLTSWYCPDSVFTRR